MADIFDTSAGSPQPWTFTAVPWAYLYATQLPLPAKPAGLVVPKSKHDAKYWARAMQEMNFRDADLVDGGEFNRILWKGLKGSKPYPAGVWSGSDKK